LQTTDTSIRFGVERNSTKQPPGLRSPLFLYNSCHAPVWEIVPSLLFTEWKSLLLVLIGVEGPINLMNVEIYLRILPTWRKTPLVLGIVADDEPTALVWEKQ
jgi:hypothetical protein